MANARTIRPVALLALFIAACTPGGSLSPGGAGGSASLTIDVSLSAFASQPTFAGNGAGYSPVVATVATGSTIRFLNTDSFAHTATAIPGASTFPAGSPFTASAQSRSGSAVSQSWSSGVMQAGQSSQTISIDAPGTYLFGCFFHYGAPMRGAIVAQ